MMHFQFHQTSLSLAQIITISIIAYWGGGIKLHWNWIKIESEVDKHLGADCVQSWISLFQYDPPLPLRNNFKWYVSRDITHLEGGDIHGWVKRIAFSGQSPTLELHFISCHQHYSGCHLKPTNEYRKEAINAWYYTYSMYYTPSHQTPHTHALSNGQTFLARTDAQGVDRWKHETGTNTPSSPFRAFLHTNVWKITPNHEPNWTWRSWRHWNKCMTQAKQQQQNSNWKKWDWTDLFKIFAKY